MANGLVNLTKGRLARNVLWNLFGAGMPLLVALFAIPLLIDGLGTARFGVLTLAWMVVGYFSLFDIGLGRALTKLVAERLGTGKTADLCELIWTALTLMVLLGILGGTVLATVSPWLVRDVLNVPADLQTETLGAFLLLACAIPIILGGTGFRGILEAHQRFGLINSIRIPLGMFIFIGPVAVLPFSNSLVPVVATLVVARLLSFAAYGILSFRVESSIKRSYRFSRGMVGPLVGFGGWMTISNIVGPLMVYMDRFIIGSMISMTAVAYYSTPYEVVTKLWIIPGALMGVVFPAFSAIAHDRARAARMFHRALGYILLALFPMVVVIVTFAREGLYIWLGEEFADASSLVMQLLVIGVFVNSYAYVPSALLQGAGRPDLTAKLHLLELPFYLLFLWSMLDLYGITGVAIAWVARVSIDALALFIMAQRFVFRGIPIPKMLLVASGVGILTLVTGTVTVELFLKVCFVSISFFAYLWLAWYAVLEEDDKSIIREKFTGMVNAFR